MSPSQFQQLLARFDTFEEKFETRLRRVEITLGSLTGALVLLGFLIQSDIIKLGGN